MPIPKRSKALRAASKHFRGHSGIQHAAVLAAVKTKPSGRRKGAGLDRRCAQRPVECAGWDGGMAAAEPRNVSGSTAFP